MKNLLLLIAFVLPSSLLFSQKIKNDEIPSIVIEKFKSLYINVADVKWEMENGKYEAEFSNNNIETSIVIDADGNLFETETKIDSKELPDNISVYLSRNYSGKAIQETSKIIDINSTVFYEVEIDDKDLIFNEGGRLVRTENNDEEIDKD